MSIEIRPYHPSDLTALYRICLLTGDSGADARSLYSDPDLLGHYYIAPYAVFEPDLCFVLTCSGSPCGYIAGTKNSAEFSARCEEEWFPPLRQRYPLPHRDDRSNDARMIRLIHTGHTVKNEVLPYPAHLHIDILPEAQGQGMGRRLIDTFTLRLAELGIPALHLEVGKRNTGAILFYERTGFERIKEYEHSIAFGRKLISL